MANTIDVWRRRARRVLERVRPRRPAGRRRRRRRSFWLRDYGIPAFLVVYLFLALVRPLSQALVRPVADISNHEIFPFFAWTLYSFTPGWNRTENAVVVHSMDGKPVPGIRYVIPPSAGPGRSDRRVLERVVGLCGRPLSRACDEAARDLIAPIVRRATGGGAVEFSIVTVDIDLRGLRDAVRSRGRAGMASKTDYYRPVKTIGRWAVRRSAGDTPSGASVDPSATPGPPTGG